MKVPNKISSKVSNRSILKVKKIQFNECKSEKIVRFHDDFDAEGGGR